MTPLGEELAGQFNSCGSKIENLEKEEVALKVIEIVLD
jgi:hypothetical protein